MQIARFSIEKPFYTWLLILFCLFGDTADYLSVGRLEDPVFTLKSALVITPYPGATAQEVSEEVSEVLVAVLQQMDEVDYVTSSNRPGISAIEVVIKDTYDRTELPQVWDDLRDRVADASGNLPPGARLPQVNDDFGDVFGLLYAVTAPGNSDADLWEITTFLRHELLTVDGVANAEVPGLPNEAIFVEPASLIVNELGIPPDVLLGAIASADDVTPTGALGHGRTELQTEAPVSGDSARAISSRNFGFLGEVINLLDVASVSSAQVDTPREFIRHNGVEAFTLGVAGLSSENNVTVGIAVEARMVEVATLLPAGVSIEPVYEQHRVVAAANDAFLINLAMSVGIVVGVLALFIGWRAAVVVGGSLLLTVSFTFFSMNNFDIKVERISLGAFIIAMGMLVENAIVVAEGMQVQMRRGRKAVDAAVDVARRNQVPLLGATVIGILAFTGIGFSPGSSGEFLFTLFAAIAISLLLSWLLAVTVTLLLGSYLFKAGDGSDSKDPYNTLFFRAYGSVVRVALRIRWLVIIALIGASVAGVGAMGLVKQQFFPPATTPLVYPNYQDAQGTTIHAAADDLAQVEAWLMARSEVTSVTTTVGASMTRFMHYGASLQT